MMSNNANNLNEQIAYLEAHILFLYKYLGMSYVFDLTASSDPEILQALKRGDLPEVIKLYSKIGNPEME